MEPRIQYANTADGVNIAFWALGEGPPVLFTLGLPWNHIELEWQIPEFRSMYERIAQRSMLVRYDARGCGSSARRLADLSLDAYLLDIEAIVSRLGLNRFILVGVNHSAPVAIAFAARHPQQVSHLILLSPYATASELYQTPEGEAFRALRDKDWTIYTEAIARILVGWSGERAGQVAAFLRECVTQPENLAAHRAIEAFDVADLLPQVTSPTLIFYERRGKFPPPEQAKSVAARIADARLVALETSAEGSVLESMAAAEEAILEFVAAGPQPAAERDAGAFRTVLFTDIEGSTAMTQRLGDAKAREVLREHERIVREALKSHGGAEVKTMGDGFMASFGSATKALECAVAIQRAFEERNAGVGAHHDAPLHVRIGLNAGEPIAEEEDLFGTAVILAARIAARAQGGEILASNVVRELVAGKGFLFADRGDAVLRGLEDPVRLFEVRWLEE